MNNKKEFVIKAKQRVSNAVKAFVCDESGATAIEYGLLVGMICVAIMGTLLAIGETISDDIFGVISAALKGSVDG